VQTIRGIGFADGQELEAIKLVSKLTEDYGGKIDKVTAAYGNFVAKGKVGIADINKFTAQGIPILDELEKSYGKNRSQILDMAKAGDITAQALSDALVRIANRSDEVTKRTSSSWSQVWDNLKQGASTSANAFGIIIGSLVGVSANVTNSIANFFSQLYVNMVNGAVNAAARIADALASSANNIAAFYKANPLAFGPARDLAVSGLEQFKTGARGTAKQLRALTQAAPQVGQIGAIGVPGQVSPSGTAGKSGADKAARDAERAAEAAAREAARVKDVIRDRLAEGQIINLKAGLQDRIAAAEAVSDKMLVARLQSQERELTIQYRYAQELAKEVNLDAQKAIMYEGQNALVANQIALQRELDELQKQSDQDRLTAVQKYVEKQYELNTAVQRQQQLADGIANTLGEGMASAFDAIIQGSESFGASLRRIASGVLIDIANQLLRIFVIEQAINAIKGVISSLSPFSAATPLGAGGGMVGKFGTLGPNFGIPQRAKGGPVMGGSPYIVGERGPELFVPGSSGTIIPNNKMGGGVSIVVNVDASGSSVEGDEQEGKQLGRVIAAAMQAELIKQKRPGGLLA
jgi:tape measure domain-containing protein